MAKRVIPTLREGRYNKSLSPEEFKARNPGSRPSVTIQILHTHYRMLWELGNGRLTYGLQKALQRLKELEDEA